MVDRRASLAWAEKREFQWVSNQPNSFIATYTVGHILPGPGFVLRLYLHIMSVGATGIQCKSLTVSHVLCLRYELYTAVMFEGVTDMCSYNRFVCDL